MNKQYKELAQYYDTTYQFKDYKEECEKVNSLIRLYKKSKGKELLEVACGTGNHIKYLKRNYNITGIDLNTEMLEIAMRKFPDIRFVKADMKSFVLKKKFDVIVCLFSSIAYLKNLSQLKKAIKNFSDHLADGGVMLIEPFIRPETFKTDHISSLFINQKDFKFYRVSVNKRKNDRAIFDEHVLVADKTGVKYMIDRHELLMFQTKEFLSILKNEGLKCKYLKNGLMKNRGLFIGVKL